MNEHELARRRWSRCEDALRRAAGDAGRRAEEVVAEIIADMREREESGEAGNVHPDPRLVDELIEAKGRERVLAEKVLPLVEKCRTVAFAQQVPLPQPPRR